MVLNACKSEVRSGCFINGVELTCPILGARLARFIQPHLRSLRPTKAVSHNTLPEARLVSSCATPCLFDMRTAQALDELQCIPVRSARHSTGKLRTLTLARLCVCVYYAPYLLVVRMGDACPHASSSAGSCSPSQYRACIDATLLRRQYKATTLSLWYFSCSASASTHFPWLPYRCRPPIASLAQRTVS